MSGKESFPYELSFIVVCYHSDINQIRQTLRSALMQKDVHLEIVVADDGSPENHREEIEAFFRENGFTDYKLVMNPENRGTVANLISALEAAEGEYTKDISPGDFLTGPTVLKDWLAFVRENEYDWSFSETAFYRNENGEEVPADAPVFPVYTKPYLEGNRDKARWNYVVLDDAAHGSAMLCKTALELRYAKELKENGCIYSEDMMYRVMMFDGVFGGYFPKATVFYEYGTGISTGRNKEWEEKLFQDYLNTNRIICKRNNKDSIQKKMAKYAEKKTSAFAMIFVPGKLRRWFRVNYRPRKYEYDFRESENWRKQCR